MRKILLVAVFSVFLSGAVYAYTIEILQVSNIAAYELTYKAILEELAKNGIAQGNKVTIKRHIIEADPGAGLWKKIVILMKIKNKASEIAGSKPDLVITVSTPGTKYSMDTFTSAGIPVVFTCVANPLLLGCKSVDEPLPGVTGATLYIDPYSLLSVVKMAKPDIKKLGMVYSDDDNAIWFAKECAEKAQRLGITIVSKQVEKSDPITPAAKELLDKGIDAFAIPLDQYYGLRNLEPARDIMAFAKKNKKPIFSFANFDFKGALLYLGPDFGHNGTLAARQAVAILKYGAKPKDLPILRQKDVKIIVDKEVAQNLGINLPQDLLKVAEVR